MANIRVNALTEVTSIADDDVVMVDGKQGVRATTWAALKNLIKQQCGINELNTNMHPVFIDQMILVDIAANTRTNVHYDYPDDFKNKYRRKIPVACDCATGFAQGTFTSFGDTYCEILIHNIGSATKNNIRVQFACWK